MASSIQLLIRRSSHTCMRLVQGFHHEYISRTTLWSSNHRYKSYQASQATHHELFSPLDPGELAPKKQYRIAGIKHLPDSDAEGMPEFLAVPRQGLPQAYHIQHADRFSIKEWAQHCRKLLDEELPKYGVVMFRGLPLSTGDHFSLFANALGYTGMGYEGGTGYKPYYDKNQNTFISSTEDKAFTMEPHNDQSYLTFYPHKVILYCDLPPPDGTGGLTPVTRNSEVLERLDPKVVQKFEEKQIRYYVHHPSEGKGYLDWQMTFRTDDRKEVETFLEARGLSYKWYDDGSISYWYNLPATIHHPITGEKIWFNQLELHHSSYLKHHSDPRLKDITFESDFHYPFHSTYGDGTDFEPEMLQHLRAIKWQCSVGVEWKKSDMIIFDNLKAMHGRMSYTAERRLILYMARD